MNNTDAQTDRLICRCLQVKESQVIDCIAVFSSETVRDVTRGCGAGGGCNSCHRKIRELLEARRATSEKAPVRSL